MNDLLDTMLAEQAAGVDRMMSDLVGLPDFPTLDTGRPRTQLDKTRDAFFWAGFLVHLNGIDLAPYHAERALHWAIDNNDPVMQEGWLLIMRAMTELTRAPHPGEMVH